jgi:hypothetical protein
MLLSDTPLCSARIFSNLRRYLRQPSMISSITLCGPLALRALTESLTSTTMLSFLITPILSSLNRRIFTGPSSSRQQICAYLCDNQRVMSNRNPHSLS